MNRFIRRANQRVGLGNAATLLVATSIFGLMLGFLRTKLINANFSALGPSSTDTYFAAFKIPDFFFFTLAAGALGVAFMPVLSDRLEKGDKQDVWELASSLLNFLAVIMLIVAIIVLVFARPLIHYVVAPKLSPEQLNNAVMIMRLLALNPLLFTISGILSSVQQTFGRFFFYAVAPLFYNISIIISIFLFKNNIGIVGLGIGAMIGALLQLLVVFMGIYGMSFKYHTKINMKNANFRLILKQLPPRSIDQGIDSINSIVETNLARGIGEGYLSYYENAYVLYMAPVLLIGTTISTAAFPRLTKRLSSNRPDLFKKDFLYVLQTMIWIALPVVTICYFCRGYLARLIFTRDAPEIAMIFGFLAGAIFFRILYTIISRYFYAQKNVRTPLYVSIFAIILNIFLAYTLSRPSAYGVVGLAMAQSIVAASEVFILLVVMLYKDLHLFDREFMSNFGRTLSATGFTILSAFIMISLLPLVISDRGLILIVKLSVISLVTLGTHLFASWLFGLEESKMVVNKMGRFILKPIKIQ